MEGAQTPYIGTPDSIWKALSIRALSPSGALHTGDCLPVASSCMPLSNPSRTLSGGCYWTNLQKRKWTQSYLAQRSRHSVLCTDWTLKQSWVTTVLIFLKAGGLEPAQRNTAKGRESLPRREGGERSVGKSSSPEGANQTLLIKHGPWICVLIGLPTVS